MKKNIVSCFNIFCGDIIALLSYTKAQTPTHSDQSVYDSRMSSIREASERVHTQTILQEPASLDPPTQQVIGSSDIPQLNPNK